LLYVWNRSSGVDDHACGGLVSCVVGLVVLVSFSTGRYVRSNLLVVGWAPGWPVVVQWWSMLGQNTRSDAAGQAPHMVGPLVPLVELLTWWLPWFQAHKSERKHHMLFDAVAIARSVTQFLVTHRSPAQLVQLLLSQHIAVALQGCIWFGTSLALLCSTHCILRQAQAQCVCICEVWD
jgi:hypothetical protein